VTKTERQRSKAFGVHGGWYFWEAVLPGHVARLGLPAVVVNERTGLRQIGFREAGDPCSIQLEKNGSIRIYPHVSDENVWRGWAVVRLVEAGMDYELACKVAETTKRAISRVEVPVARLSPGLANKLPKEVKTDVGVAVAIDNTPEPNTLELKVDVAGLSSAVADRLGIHEIRGALARLDVLEKGMARIDQAVHRLVDSQILLNDMIGKFIETILGKQANFDYYPGNNGKVAGNPVNSPVKASVDLTVFPAERAEASGSAFSKPFSSSPFSPRASAPANQGKTACGLDPEPRRCNVCELKWEKPGCRWWRGY
jgi:hypothetical protein